MNSRSILVVDDNLTNLKLACDLLEFEGYEVRRAQNAGEALEAIKEKKPALILMDIQMPGMDGLTLTRLLKSDEATNHITIVAMTSFAMKGDEERARESGCDGYLTKPIDTRKLCGHVAAFLNRTKPQRPKTNIIPSSDQMNILLIEDDPSDRKLLSAVLTTSGNSVFEHASAEAALRAVKNCKPQVVLLDLKLPGMDGLAFARRLKDDSETKQIPIVAMTAAPEVFTREAALSAGCDAYILKPVDTRKLPEQIFNAVSPPGG